MKSIYYWSPSLSTNIATNKAVINSAYSINKYSKKYKASILNACGEFSLFKTEIKKKKTDLIDLNKINLISFLPKLGKIKSRLSYILIFIISFRLLKNKIKNDKPDFLVVHLITSLPLVLLLFNKFQTKFILRISGYPHLNFFRRYLWKKTFKKLHLITCPTKLTRDLLIKLNFTDEKKIKILEDPIIEVKDINIKKNFDLIEKFNNKYILAVGRLTKQKNFLFLVKAYHEFIKDKNNYNLVIAGEGEMYSEINSYIIKHALQKRIFLIGYKDNIFPYFKKASCYVMCSQWEDPGFVLIESFFLKIPVISSNCRNGPKELIVDQKNGFKFENNKVDSFVKSFNEFENSSNDKIKKMIKSGLIVSKKYTIFTHYNSLINILDSN
jgi:glycosyltransferase involved in cell wall biosynthesis